MTEFGYTLSSEEHSPTALVDNAVRAEAAGFDFVSISDHFHPWVSAPGHSPFVWSVLGAIASSTDRIAVGVGVSCPTTRIDPAIVAQASATTSLLLGDRFFLGVGTGEALNEHVLGHRWPRPEARRKMLEEAVGIIRRLWTGETVDHHGDFYDVDNARLFDPPVQPPPVIVSGFGDEAIELAARPDVEPILESVRTFRAAGYDHLYFHQIGPDQDGFIDFWTAELQPALATLDR